MKPDYREISVRRDSDGGPVLPSARIPKSEHSGEIGNWDVAYVFIHGFNVSRSEARDAYRGFSATIQLGKRLHELRLFWPGDANLGAADFMDFASYPTDIEDARDSARPLARFLAQLEAHVTRRPMRYVFIAHSLGCRLLLEMLKLVWDGEVEGWTRWTPSRVPLACIMAAAVPVQMVEPGGRLSDCTTLAERWLVLYSHRDIVLSSAFPLGQTLAAAMGIESRPYVDAVGLRGEPSRFAPLVPVEAKGLHHVGNVAIWDEHGSYWKQRKARVSAEIVARIAGVPDGTVGIAERIIPSSPDVAPRIVAGRVTAERHMLAG
jgi:hypothetical protein